MAKGSITRSFYIGIHTHTGGGGGICIKGDIPVALENSARYSYLTQLDDIDFYEKYYAALLKNSRPLMKLNNRHIFSGENESPADEKNLIRVIQEQSPLNNMDKEYIKDLIKTYMKDKDI